MNGIQSPDQRETVEEVWDEAHQWNEIVDQVSGKDHLTGLPNRRAYEKQISLEIYRAERSKRSLSLAVLDIDGFKQVNDKYGHLVGDQVLKDLAKLAVGATRKTDFVGRYGGEEFIFIFPETSVHGNENEEDGAFHAAERFRKLVEEKLKVKKEPITVSIGVAQWQNGDRPEQLFDLADRAMYKAKRVGRNRVIVADQKLS